MFAVSLIVVTLGTCLGLIYIGFVQKITPPSDSGLTSTTATKAAAPSTAAATTPTTSLSRSNQYRDHTRKVRCCVGQLLIGRHVAREPQHTD